MKPRILQKCPRYCSSQAWRNLYGKMMRRRYSFRGGRKTPEVIFWVKHMESGRHWKPNPLVDRAGFEPGPPEVKEEWRTTTPTWLPIPLLRSVCDRGNTEASALWPPWGSHVLLTHCNQTQGHMTALMQYRITPVVFTAIRRWMISEVIFLILKLFSDIRSPKSNISKKLKYTLCY